MQMFRNKNFLSGASVGAGLKPAPGGFERHRHIDCGEQIWQVTAGAGRGISDKWATLL
ncbi:MAG TPA: hypothetical protein VK148_11605 [Xanthobacteraceae bacterium]|jgi:hypothetical protein|nr:hypothetical protein [Xanthobacteraceae bacterium]